MDEAAKNEALRSEREATLVDAQNPEVAAEEQDWEAALADDID